MILRAALVRRIIAVVVGELFFLKRRREGAV
jgi:hypothetical protein